MVQSAGKCRMLVDAGVKCLNSRKVLASDLLTVMHVAVAAFLLSSVSDTEGIEYFGFWASHVFVQSVTVFDVLGYYSYIQSTPSERACSPYVNCEA